MIICDLLTCVRGDVCRLDYEWSNLAATCYHSVIRREGLDLCA